MQITNLALCCWNCILIRLSEALVSCSRHLQKVLARNVRPFRFLSRIKINASIKSLVHVLYPQVLEILAAI